MSDFFKTRVEKQENPPAPPVVKNSPRKKKKGKFKK